MAYNVVTLSGWHEKSKQPPEDKMEVRYILGSMTDAQKAASKRIYARAEKNGRPLADTWGDWLKKSVTNPNDIALPLGGQFWVVIDSAGRTATRKIR